MANSNDQNTESDLDKMAASVAAAAAKVPSRRRSASLDVSGDERRSLGDEADGEGSRRSRRDSAKSGTSRRSMSYQGRQSSVFESRGNSPDSGGGT